MTTPDFPDWQDATATVEAVSAQLVAGSLLASNGASQTFDVSRYASVSVQFTSPGALTGARYCLVLSWVNAGNVVDYETVTFHDYPAIPDHPGVQMVHLPVRASSLQLSVIGDTNNNCGINAWASTRVVDGERPRIARYNWGQQVLDSTLVNIAAAGSSATFYVPPVSRAILLEARGAFTGTIVASGVALANGGLVTAPLVTLTYTGATTDYPEIPVPATGLELVMNNTAGAIRTGRVVVWDCS